MPEFDKAEVQVPQKTPRRVARRGFRRVSLMLRTKEYEYLATLAEEQDRTPDQQAAHLLRLKLQDVGYERAEQASLEGRDATDGYTAPDMEMSAPER